ncbi:CPBP family intramembrane glutamic endopeptidase [Microbacterium testaceum]|uniref:CPBP family intramembrane glutamic endopeptidase n=1 Tax=Microbacterium testaceum TaxID=2033 RepID=UPI001D17B974|nr:CPBP family intramembrane glutamic endopeptidase [Microbacterium testaceum]MCC4249440.1 CPBP family intramembrane metalloprotease [Microbacterium testaceum]
MFVPLLIGGVGTFLSAALGQTFVQPGGVLALMTLWTFLLAGFVYFARRVPIRSLFAFRASDVVWGVGLAAVLRQFEGILNGVASAPFPVATSPSVVAWFGEVVVPIGVIGPVVEELYFRAFLTVAVFRLLAPRMGRVIAGVAATGFSAGAFVLLHTCFAPLGLIDAIVLLAVGATCAVLVTLTGRIWGAVLLHASYNILYVTVAALGAIAA